MATKAKTEVRGNVFEDLQIPEAAEALARAEITARICALLSKRKLTQTQAARILGIDQPKVSALMRGHLQGFSSDRLFRFLNALGCDVEIVIFPRSRSRRLGRIRVLEGKAS